MHTLHLPSGRMATELFWYESEFSGPERSHNLSSEWFNIVSFEKFHRRLIKQSNFKEKLTLAFQKYSRALDEVNFDNAFIKLWNVLELLLNAKVNSLSYSSIIKRVSFLYFKDKYHQQILTHLKDIRNKYVHTSTGSNQNEYYLHQVRRYVEMVLYYHLRNVYNFETFEESCSFLDNSNDVKEINNRIKILRKASKFRTEPN